MGRIISKTITLFLIAISSQACGLSVGNTSVGTTGFLEAHHAGRNNARMIEKWGSEANEMQRQMREK